MGWRCTFHRPTMTFGMRWRGVAWHAMAFIITILDSRSPKQTLPRLTSSQSRLGSFTITGFPWGFPIASPRPPPLSGKSHKHPSPPTPFSPPPRPLFPWDNLLSLAATHSSWGYRPALPNSRSPRYHTFHLRALHLVFACFSLLTKHPPHSSSPGSSTRTAPALRSCPFSCSVILHPNPKASASSFERSAL